MKDNYCVIPEIPGRYGCYRTGKDIHVCAYFNEAADCGVCLFDNRQRIIVKFDESLRHGNVYCVVIQDVPETVNLYMLYENGNLFCDPYAVQIEGLENFGEKIRECDTRCRIYEPEKQYDWKDDHRPETPLEDSIIYCLNVRGYTMSSSSGIRKNLRGTFKGLEAKIPYMKELGITAVELMPAYELKSNFRSDHFTAVDANRAVSDEKADTNHIISHNGSIKLSMPQKELPNLWGFGAGWYLAPRTAYCFNKQNPCTELKDMIRCFHENGIEIVMQFFFAEGTPTFFMLEAVRYWVLEYHIDGVHFKGMNVPVDMIAADPLLSDIKLMNDYFNYNAVYGLGHKAPKIRHLAEYRDDFEYISRQFLKGDDNSVNPFLSASVANGLDAARINYICNYDGFRLADLVSYEHKHNDDNGENNSDGNEMNYSWNCGIEGATRKRSICALRKQQIKNILTMLFMAQGTPVLFGGDEFGNTQQGNNNPYCQDNEIGWVSWKLLEKNQEIFKYTSFLISLRMKHLFLHEKYPLRLMDYKSCGYPDLSYHGKEAWIPDLSGCSHSVALMFSGFYEKNVNSFIYIVYNMHWKNNVFALPRLPDGMTWHLIADTSENYDNAVMLKGKMSNEMANASKAKIENSSASSSFITVKDGASVVCEARSVCIFEGTGFQMRKILQKYPDKEVIK